MQDDAQRYVLCRRRAHELERLLGTGAFGSVYQAHQTTLDRKVAVKFFDNKFMQSDQHRARFEREAQLLARIEHRAIPYVLTRGELDATDAKPTPYTVMQFVPGMTLAVLMLSRGGKLDWKAAAEIMTEVLSALDAAHRAKIVHRDVKPDNVLHGEGGTYLIDFSIGMSREYSPGLPRATRTGDVIGAVDYVSPEQQRDSSSVDYRTDIYSAGIVLFELLSGHSRIANLESLPAAEIPKELRAVVQQATQYEPKARFASAQEFREALRALLRPGSTWQLEPSLALCPNTRCEGALWTQNSYFRGPRVIGETRDRHCARCGSSLVKSCPGCRAALPPNLADMVSKMSKREPDRTKAYCAHCGHLLFSTPTCESCGSYLRRESMDRDTKADGCTKCRPTRMPSPFADDIPF